MALIEKTEYHSLTILVDGQIQVRRDRVVIDDVTGEELGRRPWRKVLEPGEDVSMFPKRVRDICAVVWTPQVISDYQAAKAAREASLP